MVLKTGGYRLFRNAVISYRLSVDKRPRPDFNEEATAENKKQINVLYYFLLFLCKNNKGE